MKLSILQTEKPVLSEKTGFPARGLLISGLVLFWVSLFTPPVQALTMEEVAREIMSPACPGQLLVDCPSGEGAQLRELIRQKIARGETKEQIIKYFVEIYGEDILAAPPKKGFFLTLWYLPYLFILNGIGVVALISLIWVKRRKGPAASPIAQAPQVIQEDKYLDRVEKELEEFKY